MNILLDSIIFILATLLIYFILFQIASKIYSFLSKKSLLILGYFKRLLMFFLMICSAAAISYYSLQFFGLSSFSNSITHNKQVRFKNNNEEIARVEKFLHNYENLSLNDLQKEIPHLKTVFYKLKEDADFYNSQIEIATKRYSETQQNVDSLAKTSDSLKVVTQNQFNIIFAEIERRSDEKANWATFIGIVLGIITSLIASFIYEKVKKK